MVSPSDHTELDNEVTHGGPVDANPVTKGGGWPCPKDQPCNQRFWGFEPCVISLTSGVEGCWRLSSTTGAKI